MTQLNSTFSVLKRVYLVNIGYTALGWFRGMDTPQTSMLAHLCSEQRGYLLQTCVVGSRVTCRVNV